MQPARKPDASEHLEGSFRESAKFGVEKVVSIRKARKQTKRWQIYSQEKLNFLQKMKSSQSLLHGSH